MSTPPRGDRTAMMPKRTLPRAKQRAADIAAERQHNHTKRTTIGTPVIDDYDHQEYERQHAINYGLQPDPEPPPF